MVLPNIAQNYKNHIWSRKRVILPPKNVDVFEINFKIQNKIAGELMTYKSVVSVTDQDDAVQRSF